MTRTSWVTLALATLWAMPAQADEGMWTFDHFPKETVQKAYGFEPATAWLDQVRLASARIAGGCSASFVSADGLVMTNHHCAHSCIQQLSTKDKDFVQAGFYAATAAAEVKCPEIEINQLVGIDDVTARVNEATKGKDGAGYAEAQKATTARIEKDCQLSESLRCEVVSLYGGGQYHLYRYQRYQDVRLVFAPELAIAFFGGDPDNFVFPRYDLDVSFLRVYSADKPAKMANYFKWSAAGAKEGELTFVSGHPGGTDRQLTAAELEYQRDVALPEKLLTLAQLRGLLTQYQERGAEEKRVATHDLFGVENGYKALRGRWSALLDKAFFASKVAEDQALRDQVAKDPGKQQKYGAAWDAIAKAVAEQKKIRLPLRYIAWGSGFSGRLFGHARMLVQGTEELTRPNEKRFEEYRDTDLPQLQQRLFSKAPIYPALEIEKLTFSLTKMREELGADDAFVKKVLGKESPRELATRLVQGSKLADPEVRKLLWQGGKAAVVADKDPLLELARLVDADSRAWRKRFEEGIEPVIKKNSELIAKARFETQGTSRYPDATFTLRLSYGSVQGYEENGKTIKPFTTFGGAFDRATGRDPFALPTSWLKAQASLDSKTPFNFCTSNDIIGGNSGSPVINKNAEVVGLIFDGNLQSLGGEYGFDATVNRAVAVHSEALIQALSKIYGAERVAKELRAAK
jgi:hypothetical protein